MIEPENFVMCIDINAIGFPFPDKNQVNKIYDCYYFTAEVGIIFSDENSDHDNNLNNEMIY